MFSKTFAFTKIQKTTSKIEDDLNAFLKNNEFKFATQNESATKGKFIVTLFVIKGKESSIRVKAFKNQHIDQLDKDVNSFLKKNGMKFATQTFVGSSIYTLVFYDSKVETENTSGNGSNGSN